MADFQTSTHREKWIFTQQDLMQKREAANQRAVKMLEQYGSTRLEVDVDGSLSYPEPLHDSKDKAERHSPKPLNCEEEQFMRVFYEQKIQEVCGAFRFPHKIQATAIIYFKRFYLQWSVMEHQPKHIMLTCIYSSCKVEENHVSAEELGKGIQQDHQIILNNEMIVLQSLGFDLIVYPPYRSIEGFIEDMEEFCQARDEEQEKLKELREAAKSEVDRMMLTDAPLLFTPGQLALAALHRSNEVLRVLDFERYLESILSRQGAHTISEVDRMLLTDAPLLFTPGQLALAALHRSNEVLRVLDFERYLESILSRQGAHTISELAQSMAAIDILLGKLKIPTAKDMSHIDRKLKRCWDPSSQDESKKREKRSKHKSKRTAAEMQGGPA